MTKRTLNYCAKPGRGYYCTWAEGHLGECDSWPEWWTELGWWFSEVFAKFTTKGRR